MFFFQYVVKIEMMYYNYRVNPLYFKQSRNQKLIEGRINLKIILTNDDGIQAPGLYSLFLSLQNVGRVVVVAPKNGQSGIGHKVTTHSPIRLEEVARNRYSVEGTPADCIRIALKEICPDADWVISGINPGANLGSDVYQSGTVAAAREAAILDRRAIAISQYIAKDHQIDWEITKHHADSVLKMLIAKNIARGFFWNVNIPHPLTKDSGLEYEYCDLDTNPHKYEYQKEGNSYTYVGTIHERPRDPGKDVDVCFSGKIAISCIPIGLICSHFRH
jgi:5'-nucleotidase